jgi:hypothetical protein
LYLLLVDLGGIDDVSQLTEFKEFINFVYHHKTVILMLLYIC